MADGVSEGENGAGVLRGLKGLSLQTTKPESSPDSWESLERRGNEHFVAGKYDLAITAYTEAIEIKRKVAPLKEVADLLANRAAAWFADEKPMDAYWDCKAALNVQPGHLKATLRLAKAQAAALRWYAVARDLLVASSHATRPEFQSEISRMNRLVRENQNGEYDLKSMLKEAAASKTPRLDHADYNGGVREKWISEEKGNGLVARRDFAPGDLLFACKAFTAVCATECKPATFDSMYAECLSRIIRRISKNRDLVKELYRLYAGPEFNRFDSDKCEAPTVDPERVAVIVLHNAVKSGGVEGMHMIEGELQSFAAVRYGFSFDGWGVWILASFMNHSCLPNTVNFFVGDILFVRATERIRKGDELTTSYVSCLVNDRQNLLGAGGFKCECNLCVCDLKRVTEQPYLEGEREAFFNSIDGKMLQRVLELKELRPTIMNDVRKWAEEFKSRLSYQNRYDVRLNIIYAILGDGFVGVKQWLNAAKAFEVALCAAVGKGTDAGDTFDSNSLTRNAFFLCLKTAHSYLLGRDLAKAKKYLAKAQTAAIIAWGSADIELLKMFYPGLPVEDVFTSLA